jgi:hypothetical protein
MERSGRALFTCSELRGGSPRLCRLRTDRLAPVSKFDYVVARAGFMGSHKFSSFIGHRVGRYPTIPLGCIRDSVWGTHEYPRKVSHGRQTLG